MSYKVLHRTFISLAIIAIFLVVGVVWIFYVYRPFQTPTAIIIIEAQGEQGARGVPGKKGIPGDKGDKGQDGKSFWGNR